MGPPLPGLGTLHKNHRVFPPTLLAGILRVYYTSGATFHAIGNHWYPPTLPVLSPGWYQCLLDLGGF